MIDCLVKYARCLAIGKITLVIFFLLVETLCHVYVFINPPTTETSTVPTSPYFSLLPLHLMVRNFIAKVVLSAE